MIPTPSLPARPSSPTQRPPYRQRKLGGILAAFAIALCTPALAHASYAEREDARVFAAEIASRHALDAGRAGRGTCVRHAPVQQAALRRLL